MNLERLDLHGYTVDDALFRFWQRYNRLLADRQGQSPLGQMWGIEVIHGKGTAAAGGLIREALRDYLKTNATRVKGFDVQLILRDSYADLDKHKGRAIYFHGEDVDRNGGKTVVVPRERLPRPGDLRPYR
jgi:hypothetical protein